MAITKSVEIALATNYPAEHLDQRERKVLQVAEQYAPALGSNWGLNPPTTQSGALDSLASANAGGVLKSLSVTYDFSVNGGAVGVIPLAASLPSKAVVVEVIRDEVTACTSTGSTGTILLGMPVDGALEQTALTADGGSPSLASSGGTAVPKKATAARTLQVTIGTNPVLSGKILYFIRYYQSI